MGAGSDGEGTAAWLAQRLDRPHHFLGRVAVPAGVGDELLYLLQESAWVCCAGHGDPAPATELEEALVA